MNAKELTQLQDAHVQALLVEHAGRRPDEVALQLRKTHPELPVALVASQLKLRQKAQAKLPKLVAAGCLFDATALEQATGEALWPHKPYGAGKLAVDIGFGCGADTLAMAARYTRVIAMEQRPELAELLRFNLVRLGIDNVEVLHADAAQWLRETDEQPDLIYLDPARRSDARTKMVAIGQMSPNLLALAPLLEQIGAKVLVKLSPLFQPTEVSRQLGGIQRVRVISHRREVKEVLAEWQPGVGAERVAYCATVIGVDAAVQLEGDYRAPELASRSLRVGDWLFQADPAVVLAGQCMHDTFSRVQWLHRLGLGGAEKLQAEWPGRWFQIEAIWPYKPKHIKRALKALGLSRAECIPIGFPGTGQQLAGKLGLKQGGAARLLFVDLPERGRTVLLCQQV